VADPITIDARGLNCPLPVLRLRKRLQSLPVGAAVELLATDRAALRDVPAFCEAQGHSVTVTEDQGSALRFQVLKGDLPKV
jgi:tRNA 2-thiouridine synthesizing protein A